MFASNRHAADASGTVCGAIEPSGRSNRSAGARDRMHRIPIVPVVIVDFLIGRYPLFLDEHGKPDTHRVCEQRRVVDGEEHDASRFAHRHTDRRWVPPWQARTIERCKRGSAFTSVRAS